MAKKLNSMRLLDGEGIAYEVLHVPETIHSALDVAAHLGIPAPQVYKTLVLLTAKRTPILVIVPADQHIEIKHLGKILGDKKLRMATHNEAEALTGLKVGGISALALRQKHFPTYIDHRAADFETIFDQCWTTGCRPTLAGRRRRTGNRCNLGRDHGSRLDLMTLGQQASPRILFGTVSPCLS